MIRERLPFQVSKNENFFAKFGEWIGDVFYDILPDKGFEERDEQIYMAFQLEKAFKEKAIVFAEAGVGTGKTIVYLLYAICYARYTGKPAIISCADESLIEQLVKEEGDIAKISRALELNIDVRLAKAQDQYLCLQKLDRAMSQDPYEKVNDVYDSLPDFVHNHSTLQSFYHYGDRKTYPSLTDEEWGHLGWDSFQDCFSCDKRHRCGLTLSRDHYRKSADLIICSHDFYMHHVWTIEARKREGQLPLLPESSCVIFDEGHLLEFSAQKALTYRVKESTLESLLTRLLENDIREEFAVLIEKTIEDNESLFNMVSKVSVEVKGSNRLEINLTDGVKRLAKELHQNLIDIGDSLVFESETFTIDHYTLNIVDEYLDQMEFSLKLLLEEDSILWVEKEEGRSTLVLMPRAVEDVLSEKVFSKNIPFIFSSATLSENKSFDYIAESLGIKKYQSFSVSSPFDYENQMKVYMPIFVNDTTLFKNKVERAFQALQETDGRALILFNSQEDLTEFKSFVSTKNDFDFLFEGEQEISGLVARFQREEKTVLCAVSLWEGLDVPGPALSNVIIWSLPFPPNDPVFQAKRKSVKEPFWTVDVPYMTLRMRQGIGRLIRSHDDKGIVTIFISSETDSTVIEKVKNILPVSVLEGNR